MNKICILDLYQAGVTLALLVELMEVKSGRDLTKCVTHLSCMFGERCQCDIGLIKLRGRFNIKFKHLCKSFATFKAGLKSFRLIVQTDDFVIY